MPVYECSRCLKKFSQKCNYTTHLNRKFPCQEILAINSSKSEPDSSIVEPCISTMESENNEKTCKGCGRSFSKRYNMLRHQSRSNGCLTIISLQKELVDTKDLFESRILVLERRLQLSESNISINSNNTINQTINFVPFGKENFGKLNDTEIRDILGPGPFLTYVKYTHLNDRIPEQQNVLVSNRRSNDCRIITEDNQIEVRNLDKIVEKMIKNGIKELSSYLEEYDVNEETVREIESLINTVNNPSLTKENEVYIKVITEQIKRLLYNHRKKVGEKMRLVVS